MQLSTSKMEVQAQVKKFVIISAVSKRSFIFLPSHNMLIIHDHDNERKVELGYSASRILEILIDRAGTIVNRDDIFAFAWPDRIVGQNSLNQAISTIRELLSDEERRFIIQTIPRRGYQFNSECLASPEDYGLSGEPDPASPGLDTKKVQFPRSRVLWWPLSCGWNKILLAVALMLVTSLFLRIDWGLWLQAGLVRKVEIQGLLTSLYVGATDQEVERLRNTMAPVRARMESLLVAPGKVIFNMMHGFYEIVCISGDTVEFVSVHKSKLATLTDEQLDRCLK